jgi:hypothetical protein
MPKADTEFFNDTECRGCFRQTDTLREFIEYDHTPGPDTPKIKSVVSLCYPCFVQAVKELKKVTP